MKKIFKTAIISSCFFLGLTNEINKLKEQIEKYRYSRDDKQTLYR